MKFGSRKKSIFCSLLLAFVATSASAEGLFSIKAENDWFSLGEDGHYTNGVEVSWTFTPSEEHWAHRLSNALPGWASSRLNGMAYRFGQQIYTPNDIGTERLIKDDRPYAGLLFGGITLLGHDQFEDWSQSSSLYFDVGIIGPASGAEEVQRSFHDLVAAEEPKGWHYQLNNEPFINLDYERSWLLQRHLKGWEVVYGPSAGFALGNLYTFASTGLGLRVGEGVDRGIGIPAVAPAHSGQPSFQIDHEGFNWYAFVRLEGRYMAHNLLLDGNTFENSHSVDRREWVGDFQVGGALGWDRWRVAYTHVWRSDEFTWQKRHGKFGSLTLSTWF
ncbi:DUF2219 family protein [Halomonas alkaliantarctica]|nr:DUF2219 family protein [Halomonas alkaliantarctica]